MSRTRKTPAAAAPARRKARSRDAVADALVPFAHLMEPGADAPAQPRAKAKRAEDDDRREDEDEQEERSRARRARRAEEDDDSGEDDDEDRRESAEEDEGEEEDGDEERDRARGRRTAAADDEESEEDDEEQDEEDERDPKARAARSRERARCGRILGSKAAAGRAAAAANLACNTTMSAKAAIRLLGTLPKQQAAAPALGQRMADFGNRPSASEAPAPDRKKAVAASWDAAMQRAGVSPRG
ncbi:hypothetical protein SAMN02745194_03128 [Roseomonas rosea]|uniref:Uncharacterized protein n=1 Tax=Muricoccus roseus TaxID=198092 RepID=A0A1M6LCP6_9PROT|nr:hypothetical protein [Roseomonas rosea]SHJ68942.1 hypothetical protein SAMN02745194_03128 [Roseomonas rosea]